MSAEVIDPAYAYCTAQDPEHAPSPECWCRPYKVPRGDNRAVYVHRGPLWRELEWNA